jgi:hypothetical protein
MYIENSNVSNATIRTNKKNYQGHKIQDKHFKSNCICLSLPENVGNFLGKMINIF